MLPTNRFARSNESFPSNSKNENVEILPLNAVRRVLYFPTWIQKLLSEISLLLPFLYDPF